MSSSADSEQPDSASTLPVADVSQNKGDTEAGPAGSRSEPELPPLSPQEFKTYNRLAETMDYFVRILPCPTV